MKLYHSNEIESPNAELIEHDYTAEQQAARLAQPVGAVGGLVYVSKSFQIGKPRLVLSLPDDKTPEEVVPNSGLVWSEVGGASLPPDEQESIDA